MPSLWIVSSLVAIFVGAALVEYRRHQERAYAIPHRIHINGTRGKSSVTRLIGAGLRAGDIPTITKVTGTFPRLILEDGTDVPVHRKAAASILEQIDIVDFAVQRGAQALVIECMALEPSYQRITEHHMVHATLPVMVNIRLDHTDVMGRTLAEVGASMANTIPSGARVLTSEVENIDLLGRLATERGAEAVQILADDVTAEEMDGFSYIEHRENVALALAVCAELGIEREAALEGMWQAEPDAGVLTRSRAREDGKECFFFNAFAANDPDSSLLVWRKLESEGHLKGERFVLLNSRPDRKDRSLQMVHLLATELGDESLGGADAVFVMGEPTDAVCRRLRSHGYPEERIVDLGPAKPEAVRRAILERTESLSSVVGMGNMGGQGAATVRFFELGHGAEPSPRSERGNSAGKGS